MFILNLLKLRHIYGFPSLLGTFDSRDDGPEDIFCFIERKPGGALLYGSDKFNNVVSEHRVGVFYIN